MREKTVDVEWLRTAIRAAEVLNRSMATIEAGVGDAGHALAVAATASADTAEREAGTVQPTSSPRGSALPSAVGTPSREDRIP